MYKCKYIQPIQPQVQFGVELKEIYPSWYLHPSLKNLMYLAQINIRNQNSTRFDIDEICGKSQSDGPIKHRLKLKELMCHGKNILNVKVAPGAPLWLIRHFLGLLPSPIFTPKSDVKHWLNFASDCYQQLIDCIKTRKNCNHLKFTIAFELAHLPDINLTFLFEFFDLLRFLSSKTLPDSKEVVDNHAALVLVKYFIPCLFERPYTPGILRKIDKNYISILLYIIHFWPELRIQIHDLLISSIDKNETKFHYFPDYLNKYANNNDYLRDIGVQTDLEVDCKSSEMSLNFTELSEMQTINSADQQEQKLIEDLSKIEVIYDNCNNMDFASPKSNEMEHNKNIFNSTPYVKPRPSLFSIKTSKLKRNRQKSRNKNSKSDASSLSSGKSKRVKVVSKKVHKCLRKSKNYEIIILELPYKVKRVKTRDIKITTLQKCAKEKRRSRSPEKKKRDKSAIKEETKNINEEMEMRPKDSNKYEIDDNQLLSNNTNTTDEYIYDTFIGKNCEETKCFNLSKINKNPFTSKVDTSSPTYIDFNSPTRSIDFTPQSNDIDLLDRITKFGWSYTKSARRKLNLNESQSASGTATATNKKNPYKICFDSEFNNNTIDSSVLLTGNCQIGKCVITEKTSKSIFDNLRRVGSRLNLLKLTAKVSVSCDDLHHSNIKYKKILKSSYSI